MLGVWDDGTIFIMIIRNDLVHMLLWEVILNYKEDHKATMEKLMIDLKVVAKDVDKVDTINKRVKVT